MAEHLGSIEIENVILVAGLNHIDQHFDQLVEMLVPQGIFGLIDDSTSGLDVKKLKQKCVSLHLEAMFTRSNFNTVDIGEQRDLLIGVA